MTQLFVDNVDGGKNVCIVGDVGSGKSTLLQEIASAYLGREPTGDAINKCPGSQPQPGHRARHQPRGPGAQTNPRNPR